MRLKTASLVVCLGVLLAYTAAWAGDRPGAAAPGEVRHPISVYAGER
jgi:hypothetical protein